MKFDFFRAYSDINEWIRRGKVEENIGTTKDEGITIDSDWNQGCSVQRTCWKILIRLLIVRVEVSSAGIKACVIQWWSK